MSKLEYVKCGIMFCRVCDPPIYIHLNLETDELFDSNIEDWTFKNPNWVLIGEL